MKTTKKPASGKPKRGRPPGGAKGRARPVITKTTVSQATYDGIRSEGRPAGRVIDDMWVSYSAVNKAAQRLNTTALQILDGLDGR